MIIKINKYKYKYKIQNKTFQNQIQAQHKKGHPIQLFIKKKKNQSKKLFS